MICQLLVNRRQKIFWITPCQLALGDNKHCVNLTVDLKSHKYIPALKLASINIQIIQNILAVFCLILKFCGMILSYRKAYMCYSFSPYSMH